MAENPTAPASAARSAFFFLKISRGELSPDDGGQRPPDLSEVEFGIMRSRLNSRHLIGKNRAECRPRLDSRIPVAHHFGPVPIDVGNIIQTGKMRRGGEI